MQVTVSRKAHFNAAHRLYNAAWSQAENETVFGKCNNEYYHGHNYELIVSVTGSVNPKTGYVVDLKKLKTIIRENVIHKVDHKNLNMDVDFLSGKIPTAENIAIGIWEQLVDKIPSGKLYSVKLYETENNYVEYKGE